MSPTKRAITAVASALLACFTSLLPMAQAAPPLAEDHAQTVVLQRSSIATLALDMQVGDVVFIRVGAKPFREVAEATNSWTNHVGVVVDTSGPEPVIGESKFPLSRRTPLSEFVARSVGGRVSVARLVSALTPEQRLQVAAAADRRAGILYDTGFNLHSRRQFCSKYVREVLIEATGQSVGEVETFSHLLARRPNANVGFWKAWYLGSIPWHRETVTPASLLRSPALRTLFDGVAAPTANL
jgi:hypothetical protein